VPAGGYLAETLQRRREQLVLRLQIAEPFLNVQQKKQRLFGATVHAAVAF